MSTPSARPTVELSTARLHRRRAAGGVLLLLASLAAATRADGAEEPAATAVEVAADTEAAIARGVEFLVRTQNPDGSWGSARRTKGLNIYAPVPGAHQAFRAGVTALCLSALVELGEQGGARVAAAITRGGDWMLAELGEVRRATPDAIYNVWAHAYALQALVRLARHAAEEAEQNPDRATAFRALARAQIDRLERYEAAAGGWCYYDFDIGTQRPAGSTISFVTGTVLIALHEAKELGLETSPARIERAIDSIHRQQKPDFSYLYGEYLKWQPMRGINRRAGSLGRSQVCNMALRLWGDEKITDRVLEEWLQRLLDRNLWLDIGRKRPVPHEAWFEIAGYFYYYGHYYGAYALETLSPERHPELARRLASVIIERQETDGSWWDYPFYDYHQPYGTAFALMTLYRCAGDAPEKVSGR